MMLVVFLYLNPVMLFFLYPQTNNHNKVHIAVLQTKSCRKIEEKLLKY